MKEIFRQLKELTLLVNNGVETGRQLLVAFLYALQVVNEHLDLFSVGRVWIRT